MLWCVSWVRRSQTKADPLSISKHGTQWQLSLDKETSDLPFRGLGILGSGWQRQTWLGNSEDVVEVALRGALSSIEMLSSCSAEVEISSNDESLFLLERGEVTVGVGISACLTRSSGLVVAFDRESTILLLLRKLRDGFASSIGGSGELSLTCIVDLTYLLGILKNVATGVCDREDEGRGSGGSTRLASILDVDERSVDLMNFFEENGVHCYVETKGTMRMNGCSCSKSFDVIMQAYPSYRCFSGHLLRDTQWIDCSG